MLEEVEVLGGDNDSHPLLLALVLMEQLVGDESGGRRG